MALKIWLPLTGHTNNQGLSNYVITNSGATVESAGKLGSCYYFDTLSYMHAQNVEISTEAFSVCYWVKYTSFTSNNCYVISLNNATSTDYQFMIGAQTTSGTFTFNTKYKSDSLELNKWYHCCVTYDGTNAYMYINGELKTTVASPTINLGATNLTINGRNNSTSNISTTGKTSFYANDIRVYDHCLSTAEVRDIAKGLVLHYDFNDPYIDTKAYDSSGYCNNGTVTGVIDCVSDTVKGTHAIDFASSGYITTSIDTTGFKDSYTIAHWVKKPNVAPYRMSFGFRNSETSYRNLYWVEGCLCFNTGDGHQNPFIKEDGTNVTYNELTGKWNHMVITGDGITTALYINGEKVGTASTYKNIGSDGIYVGNGHSSETYVFDGSIADFALYATVLSDADIKALYQRKAIIDNKGNLIGTELIATDKENKFEALNSALLKKEFSNGLDKYQRDNCTITLTDDGYRISRPANLDAVDSVYGGLKIVNTDNQFGLEEGHTYIVKMHVKGASSNNVYILWSNYMGWTSGGLAPNPTNVSTHVPGPNFNGETEVWYKWTISDSLYKVCTSSYSTFVEGQTYLSYKDFCFYYNKLATGELGTDIYVSNFRLYDITNGEKPIEITKKFTIEADFIESDYIGQKARFYKDNTVQAAQFIE